jgi:thiol:disulfide interchange protein DsbC
VAGLRRLATAVLATALPALPALGDEAAIRKALSERLPDFPKIDEVTKTGMTGLYEVRAGTEVFYADEEGEHLIQGQLIETRTRANLTQTRVAKLTAIDFASLPLQDAIVWKQGTGARKLAVFADPNCGYCKRFEGELQKVKDVTVYTFLYPVLGTDSAEKARAIWCARDNSQVWRNWMLQGGQIPKTTETPNCDAAALQRNLAFGRAHSINGTPGLVFEDGHKVPGALQAEQLEKQLSGVKGGAG